MAFVFAVLSYFVMLGIILMIIFEIMVGIARQNKDDEKSKRYERLVRMEIYALGILYPAKVAVSYFTYFQKLDVLWAILWIVLAIGVYTRQKRKKEEEK